MKSWLVVIPLFLLMVIAVAIPQLVLAKSLALAVLLGVVPMVGVGWLLVKVSRSINQLVISLALGVVPISLTHWIGTESFQAALRLSSGKSLDGVTFAEVLKDKEPHTWVRLTDARVRSEETIDLTLQSGGGVDSEGAPRASSTTHLSVAPVTLASEVTNENTMVRQPARGSVALWACAPGNSMLRDWDTQRQAVRGTLMPIDEDFMHLLAAKLGPPEAPAVVPGAGAIPAAPGDDALARMAVAMPQKLTMGGDAWCVHLEPWLTAEAARENGVSTSLVFVFSIPFFAALVMAFIALSKTDSSTT